MLATFPPSYLYEQYRDDPDLQALVKAFNDYATSYYNAIVGLNLPIYTKAPVQGPLLDWVGLSLYGIPRPVLGTAVVTGNVGGPYNANAYDTAPYNGVGSNVTFTFMTATDDQYRRIITWNFFKGDGFQFTPTWLKRRVRRFLLGADGIDPGIDQTFDISVSYGANRSVTIAPKASLPNIPLLQQAVRGGFLRLPQPYSYTVTTS